MYSLDYYDAVWYDSYMNNTKSEFNRLGEAFGISGKVNFWQAIVLAPIAIPVTLFWGIIDFLIIDVPDLLLGIPSKTYETQTPEEDRIERENNIKRYQEQLEIEREERVKELRAMICPEFYKNDSIQ